MTLVRHALPIAAAAAAPALVVALAASAAGATTPAAGSPLALSAVPVRVMLAPRSPARPITVRNVGSARVLVSASAELVAFDRLGRARLVAGRRPDRGMRSWFRIAPRRLVLAPGARGVVRVSIRPPRRASPGDHPAVVLLTTSPVPVRGVTMRTRIGVVALVHVPGRVRRRLAIVRVDLRRSGRVAVVRLRLVNRGNVAETLPVGSVRIELVRGEHRVTRTNRRPREVEPGAVADVDVPFPRVPYRGGLARITVAPRLAYGSSQRTTVLGRVLRVRMADTTSTTRPAPPAASRAARPHLRRVRETRGAPRTPGAKRSRTEPGAAAATLGR